VIAPYIAASPSPRSHHHTGTQLRIPLSIEGQPFSSCLQLVSCTIIARQSTGGWTNVPWYRAHSGYVDPRNPVTALNYEGCVFKASGSWFCPVFEVAHACLLHEQRLLRICTNERVCAALINLIVAAWAQESPFLRCVSAPVKRTAAPLRRQSMANLLHRRVWHVKPGSQFMYENL